MLYQLGLQEMVSPNIQQSPSLQPSLSFLLIISLPSKAHKSLGISTRKYDHVFRQEIRRFSSPSSHLLLLPALTNLGHWLPRLGNFRRPPSQNDENIRQLSPSVVGRSPYHLDNINADVAHLASLLATADDLPKSPKGWIKVSIPPTHTGKDVPGNSDGNTQKIVASRSL